MTLGIEDIVEVKAQIRPRGAGGREFGRTLLLTTDPTLDAGAGRVGVFASMDEVARTFTPGSGPYQAAQVYFSQVPYPRNLVNLVIGRWINTREQARLTGGNPRALEQITGRATVVRGYQRDSRVAGHHQCHYVWHSDVLGGHSVRDHLRRRGGHGVAHGVATLLQAALRGTSEATSLDEVEVVHDGTQFVVTIPQGADGTAVEVTPIPYWMDGAADVAETTCTPFQSEPDAAPVRLIVRRVKPTPGSQPPTDPFTGASADELGLDSVDITAGVDGIGAGSLTWHGSAISVDFTGAASYDDVASTPVQTALRAVRTAARADLRSATVEYDPAGFFRVQLGFDPNTDDPYPLTGFMADSAQEAASALGLDSALGGSIAQGQAAETIEGAMDAISGLDDGWYFVTVDSSITTGADLLSLSRWVQAKIHMLALDVVDEGVLTPNESTSLAAQLSALEQQRTFLVWSRTRDSKALSLAGRLSSVNFEGQNTLITPKFKSLPGTSPDIVTTAHKGELDRKWVGYYTRFGPDAIFAEGWTQSGDWIDVRYWLDWVTKAMQNEVYTLLRQHPTRVPQTDEGLASIEAAIERVCEAGRRNGGIAPGRVSEAVANDIRLASNNPAFEGFLPTGYLVVIGSIADQLQIHRDARRSPTIWVWLKGSGAMHYVTIGLVFTG